MQWIIQALCLCDPAHAVQDGCPFAMSEVQRTLQLCNNTEAPGVCRVSTHCSFSQQCAAQDTAFSHLSSQPVPPTPLPAWRLTHRSPTHRECVHGECCAGPACVSVGVWVHRCWAAPCIRPGLSDGLRGCTLGQTLHGPPFAAPTGSACVGCWHALTAASSARTSPPAALTNPSVAPGWLQCAPLLGGSG